MQVERLDKGMVLIAPVSPVKHARLMPQVFPGLPEAAAVEMHAGDAVARYPLLLRLTAPAVDVPDHVYDNFKYFLKKRSF